MVIFQQRDAFLGEILRHLTMGRATDDMLHLFRIDERILKQTEHKFEAQNSPHALIQNWFEGGILADDFDEFGIGGPRREVEVEAGK